MLFTEAILQLRELSLFFFFIEITRSKGSFSDPVCSCIQFYSSVINLFLICQMELHDIIKSFVGVSKA